MLPSVALVQARIPHPAGTWDEATILPAAKRETFERSHVFARTWFLSASRPHFGEVRLRLISAGVRYPRRIHAADVIRRDINRDRG